MTTSAKFINLDIGNTPQNGKDKPDASPNYEYSSRKASLNNLINSRRSKMI